MVDGCGGSLWNEEREHLHELLEQVNPTLAGLYHLAIHLIDESPHSWEDKARLSLVGHCFRELMNRLPDALDDVEGVPTGNQSEETKSLIELLQAHEAYRSEPIERPVPRDLLHALDRFAAARETGARIELKRDAAAVLGTDDVHDPALGPWRRARKFFMKRTHINYCDGTEEEKDVLPSTEQLMEHVQVVEAALRVRRGKFFDSYKEVEDIVSNANELNGEESIKP